MNSELLDDCTLVLLGLAVVSLVTNILLAWVVVSLRKRNCEVRLSLVLAVVDMALAVLAMISFVTQKVDPSRLPTMCKIKGPLDFVLIFASMLLVATIGMERSSVVVSKKTSFGVWAGLTFLALMFLTAVMAGVVSGEFTVSASGLDCTPDATASKLSVFVLFLLGSSLLALLGVTLYSYFGILVHIGEWDFFEAKPISNFPQPPRTTPVIIRITAIAVVYLLLLGPCSILIISEALQLSKESQSTSLFISFILATISIANPCLILFAHTTIFYALKQKFNHLVKA
ncbi:hypothetical protein DSO57_1035533 [Entomophthora muscae]|uniref:Uncharacterized protein n=1 Tax=Entomophthora muscae TaxID=34485 RepID=A0ACC2S1F6_9FUNG|nr:hypothetical protein DSO57_1035533 [Entomophthora muscae]